MSEPSKPTSRSRLALIAALDEGRVIGKGNELPWHLPADLKRFKRLTMGHPILMGRRTWESIGRPLPGRRSLVLSRDPDLRLEGAETFTALGPALEAARDAETVFVIGGAALFEATLPVADLLYLTRVHAEVEGDVHFPPFELERWHLVREERHAADERHAYPFSFLDYRRREGAGEKAAHKEPEGRPDAHRNREVPRP